MRHDTQVSLIKELLTQLDTGTTVDVGGLRANPTSVYADPDLAEREWQAFFRSHPQLIGLSGEIPDSGSFTTVDDFGTPVLATRDGDGRFRAFVNACRHRGVTVETRPRGKARRFTCGFHGWTYSDEGTLVGLPKRDQYGEVDADELGLIELPAVEHAGMLWVHPDPAGTIDVAALLGEELLDELTSWRLDELEYLDRDTYDVACNWKLAIDTFGETYHFPVLHKETINHALYPFVNGYDTFGRNHRFVLCRREIDSLRDRPEDDWDITIGTLPVYWLFPNVQMLPFRDGCYLVRIYPVPGDSGRHVTRLSFYLRPGVTQPSDTRTASDRRGEQLTIAEIFGRILRDEDYVIAASQQRTVDSGALTHVVFGRNEPPLHQYHRIFREALGLEPLPLLASAPEPGARVRIPDDVSDSHERRTRS